MSSPDPIFDQFALAADAEPADSGKTAWPEYPREKAAPAEIDQFCKTMTASFEAVGLGALLRHDEPTDVKRMILRDRIRMPADADPATRRSIETINNNTDFENKRTTIEKDARMLEYKTRIAAKISLALERKAPILLKTLKASHPCKDSSGAIIDKAYDGIGMFHGIVALKTVDVGNTYHSKPYQKAYEQIRDNKLAPNCTSQQFGDRISKFEAHVNPATWSSTC